MNMMSSDISISSSENKDRPPLNTEEIHIKLKKRFYILNEEKGKHHYFCSYDFRENEKEMVSFWSEVLNYYYDTIYTTFAIKVSKIIGISKIDSKNPIGLPNILIKLIQDGEYITQEDLNSNSLYNSINPKLYPTSILSYITSSVVSTITSYVYNTERVINQDDLYINKGLFIEHCDTLLKVLEDYLSEKDSYVITTKEFNQVLKAKQVPNGDSYLNLCLLYLSKLKKIALFQLSDEINTECIKLLKDINDTVTTKDKAIMNILLCISNLNKKIVECHKQIDFNHQRAKESLRSKLKENARMYLKKKSIYFNNEQHYNNILFNLEQNLEDLKSMESTMKVKDMMINITKAAKEIKLNPDEVENALDDLKDINYAMNDMKNDWNDYANKDDNDEEINNEIEKLSLNIKNENEGIIGSGEEDNTVMSEMFPKAPSKEKSKVKQSENIHCNLDKEKEKDDEELNKILAELN